MLHQTTKAFLEGFRYDAHPMAMFISTVAVSTVYKDAGNVLDGECRMRQGTGGKLLVFLSLPRYRGTSAPEDILLNLARGGLGQLGHNRYSVGHFEMRHVRARKLFELRSE